MHVRVPVLRANPTGEQVINGGVTFERGLDGSLTISQGSDKAIIHWQDFSIGAGELTKFVQPSSMSAVLNRVIGGLPSSIHGTLQANGRVLLINPNGILVGPTGRIDVGGFLASTLDVSDSDFLRGGDMIFRGSSTASVVNQGTINAIGGDIFLFAQTVQNSGTLNAPQGTVGLAAGTEILLAQSGDERVFVRAGGNGSVTNSGTITAATAELKAHGNLYALAVNNTGVIRATSASKKGGRVFLTATGGGMVRNSGTISARGSGGAGGEIKLDAGPTGKVENSGTLDAEAIVTPETPAVLDGTITEDITTSGGGTDPQAQAKAAAGGQIVVMAGQIDLLEGSMLRANGLGQGGTILVGGGFQGHDPKVINATKVSVAPTVTLQADGGTGGGRVMVWSDGETVFAGNISARARGAEGQGGFAEVSGKQTLDYRGVADLRGAGAGGTGTLLLDPTDFTVGTVQAATIVSNLATSSVVVSTSGAGAGAGNLTVSSPVNYTSANGLTFLAHGNINFLSSVQNGGAGAVQAVAGWNGSTGFSGASGILNGTVLFSTIVNAGSYGLNNGSIQIGATSSTTGVSVGSRFGVTNIAGGNLSVLGSNSSSLGLAQLGYRASATSGNFDINGAITVRLKGNLSLAGGIQFATAAQIGHGGYDVSAGEPDGNYQGDITINALGSITLQGGAAGGAAANAGAARIGHGGMGADGNHSGNIVITGGSSLTLLGGSANATEAHIGNGGGNADGNHGGNITVTVPGSLTITAGGGNESYAQIGNGAIFATSNITGNIAITAGNVSLTGGGVQAFAQIGHGGMSSNGSQSGTLTLIATGNLSLIGSASSSTSTALIGHGFSSTTGTRQGNIDIRITGETSLVNQIGSWDIGHRTTTALAVTLAEVYFSTGTLDYTAGTGATSTTTNADFASKFTVVGNVFTNSVTVASTGSGGLNVAGAWTNNNASNFTFLSTRDVTFTASVQNSGSGPTNVAAGWDGVTGLTATPGAGTLMDFAAIQALSSSYGKANGTIMIGTGSQTAAVAVGSGAGPTNVVGYGLLVQAGTTNANGYAVLGYQGNSVSGWINVSLNGYFQALNRGTVSTTQLGHGTPVNFPGGVVVSTWLTFTKPFSFAALAKGHVLFFRGVEDASGSGAGTGGSVVGVGGWDGVTGMNGAAAMVNGNTLFNTIITAGAYGLNGGGIQVGATNSTSGATVGSRYGATYIAGNGLGVYGTGSALTTVAAQIGYRDLNANGGYDVNAPITVIMSGNALLQGGTGASSPALIGHGGLDPVPSIDPDGNWQGDITVRIGGFLNLVAGSGLRSSAQIGHGGGLDAGNYTGNISITTGSLTLTGMGQQAYAQVGHGGYNTNGSDTGAITITSTGAITLTGGDSSDAYAQIGHGGSTMASGAMSGNIGVSASSLTLMGGNGTLAYAAIGHGAPTSAGTRQGNVDVRISGETSLVNGIGTNAIWMVGHSTATAGGISAASVLFSTGTLDYTIASAATLTTPNVDFVTKFIGNLAGGAVTVGSSGTSGLNVANAWSYNSANALTLLATRDIAFGADVQNSGTGALNVGAGWDNVTGLTSTPGTGTLMDFAAIQALPSSYGNANGTIAIGTGGQSTSLSVGSRFGPTNIVGNGLNIRGSNSVSGVLTQIGFRGSTITASFDINAPITVIMSGDVLLQGGSVASAPALIGHGGLDLATSVEPDGNWQGDITVRTGGSLNLLAGVGLRSSAQVGHGGSLNTGNYSGNITVVSGRVTLIGSGQQAYAQLGHGGYTTNGSHTGSISITSVGAIALTGGANFDAYAQIGHGGSTMASGAMSGNVTVSASGLTLAGGSNSLAYAVIGHGAPTSAGTRQGKVDVRISSETSLVNGTGANAIWMVGHSTTTSGGISAASVLFSTGTLDYTTGSAATLTTLNADFATKFIANLAGGDVTVASTGTGGLNVANAWSYSISNALTLLSTRNVAFNASVQNSGAGVLAGGALNIGAGWDGTTGLTATPGSGPLMNFAAIQALSSSYGNNLGSVNVGTGSQSAGVAVGSRSGATNMTGYAVNVLGGSITNAFAVTGYYSSGFSSTGSINLLAKQNLTVTAGPAQNAFAQVGHGAGGNATYDGNITVTAQNVTLRGAGAYVQIGHGGSGSIDTTTMKGAIVLNVAGDFSLTGGSSFGSYAAVGHRAAFGSRQGNIDIRVGGETSLVNGTAGSSDWSIGHRTSSPQTIFLDIVSNAQVNFSTGTLDYSNSSTASLTTLNADFATKILANIAGGDVSVASTGAGGLMVAGSFTFETNNNLTFLSTRDVQFAAGVQSTGGYGQLNLGAGWDAATGLSATPGTGTLMNFAAIQNSPSSYGNSNGTIYIGTGIQASVIAVGTNNGGTNVVGYGLVVQASTTNANGHAQLGINGVGSGVFDLRLKSFFHVLNRGTVAGAEFGNGGSFSPGGVIVNGSHEITLPYAFGALAAGSVAFYPDFDNGGFQNSATSPGGNITVVSGWDGTTGVSGLLPVDYDAIRLNPASYGNNQGSVGIGSGLQFSAVSVGSRFGTTNVAGYSLTVKGSVQNLWFLNPTDTSAQLGFRPPTNASSYSISGPINVLLKNSLTVAGGNAIGSWAQVGNGGPTSATGQFSNNFGGDISIIATSGVSVQAGTGISQEQPAYQAHAQIGNGGVGNASSSGNLSITTGFLSIWGGGSSWAALGNGGYGSDGNHSGNIKVTASSVELFAGSTGPGSDHYAQIGHGGALADGNHSGSIVMAVSGSLRLAAGAPAGAVALIGHGSGSTTPTTGTRQGLIDVRVGGSSNFSNGLGIPGSSIWIIGHRSSTTSGVSNSEIYFSTGTFGFPFPTSLNSDFMNKFGSNATNSNSPVTVAITGAGGMTVGGSLSYNASSAFTLLSTRDITFNASVQNSGLGAINIGAGWDGTTGRTATPGVGPLMNFAAIQALPSSYGNLNGSVIIGSGTQITSIAVGSSGGSTNVAAYALTVQAGTTSAFGIAQLGYRNATVGTGAFNVDLISYFHALNRGTLSTTQIGHGLAVAAGSVVITSSFAFDQPFSFGALARVDVSLLGGKVQNSAGTGAGTGGPVTAIGGWDGVTGITTGQPLNVSSILNASASYGNAGGSVRVGNFSGVTAGSAIGSRYATTTVAGYDVRLSGNGNADDTERYAQIGFRVAGSTTGMNVAGAITVRAKGATVLSGFSLANSDTQIGHGGRGFIPGAGPGGNWSGSILIDTGVMSMDGNGSNAGYAQVGHGGAGTSGARSGDITVNVTNQAVQTDLFLDSAAHIGHGGQDQQGDAFGDIWILADRGLTMNGWWTTGTQIGHGGNRAQGHFSGDIHIDSSLSGIDMNSFLGTGGGYAQIGHGGDSAVGVFEGAIDATAHYLSMTTYSSSDPAQIGHGGMHSTGAQRGDITIQTDDNLLLKGSGGGTGHQQIGHGDAEGLGTGTREGTISVEVAGVSFLAGDAGAPPLWQIGHGSGTAGGVCNAPLSFTTGSLGYDDNPVALPTTAVLNQEFSQIFSRNVAGGNVVINVRGPANTNGVLINNGNWNYNSEHDLTFISTRDITLNGSISNAGIGSLTFITDDENSARPFANPGARFINNATTVSAGGGVSVFAASPYTSVMGNLAGLPRRYDVWFGEVTAITGFNFKLRPTITLAANNQARLYGQANPAFGFSVSGLVPGDTLASIFGGTPAPTSVAGPTSHVGSYAIQWSANLTPLNAYVANFLDATLTVNPAPLKLTAKSALRISGTNFTFSGTEFTAAGLQNGENVELVSLFSFGAFANASTKGSPYTIFISNPSGGSADLSNYSVTFQPGKMIVLPDLGALHALSGVIPGALNFNGGVLFLDPANSNFEGAEYEGGSPPENEGDGSLLHQNSAGVMGEEKKNAKDKKEQGNGEQPGT